MEEIVFEIKTLMEDKPHLILTDDIIKGYIEENIDLLVEEIKREME